MLLVQYGVQYNFQYNRALSPIVVRTYWCISLNDYQIWEHVIVNLKTNDAIWWHRSGGATNAQVKACCLMAPIHYLNRCWLITSEVQWQSLEENFTRDTTAINLFKISFKSLRGQWAKKVSMPFFSRNINMYLEFTSFHHTDITEVVEILPHVKQGPT